VGSSSSGAAAGCVEPANWRQASRIGEYFGLAQAAGIAWTGNSGTPPSGQQILFNYADGIAPVVTAPGPISPTSCSSINLGTATATDTCGLAPLSAVTNDAPAHFGCGPVTVTYSATDGAGNVGHATQVVTVSDSVAPTIAPATPATVNLTTCQPTAQAVTLTVPTATGSCTGVTVTGKITTFTTLTVAPTGTIQVDNAGGKVFLDVSLNVVSLGIVTSNGTPNQFVLGYTGILPVNLLTSFTGTVIAPNAAVALAQPLFGSYTGAFFGQDIAIAAGVRVTEYPYTCDIP
jgi:hypothetical protein